MTSSLTSQVLDQLHISTWTIGLYDDVTRHDILLKKHFERMTSPLLRWSRDVIGDVTNRLPLATLLYRLPIEKNLLSPTVFEISGLKYYEFMTSSLTSWRLDYLPV